MHPDSPLIDGAIPRSGFERCDILLRYLEDISPVAATIMQHRMEQTPDEYWHEMEDELIDKINDLFPDDTVMLLHPDDPGTIVIWYREDMDDDV